MAQELQRTREYKEELRNMKIALFKENRPQDMLTEDNQDQILKGCSLGLQKENSHSSRLERGAQFMCAPTNSLVSDSLWPLTITGWDEGSS